MYKIQNRHEYEQAGKDMRRCFRIATCALVIFLATPLIFGHAVQTSFLLKAIFFLSFSSNG